MLRTPKIVRKPNGRYGLVLYGADMAVVVDGEELRRLRDEIDRVVEPRRRGPSETKEG